MERSGDNSLLEHSGFTPGAIFMSNRKTKEECFRRNLFGLPSSHASLIKKIRCGMFLFLFEYEERNLYGVFEATSDGSMNIVPNAFARSGKVFSAQVRFRTIYHSEPLTEAEFRDAIKENYYEAKKFHFELSKAQVYKLFRLFVAKQSKIGRSFVGISDFSLESRYPGISEDSKKHEFRNTGSTILHHSLPAGSSDLEYEAPLYSTFSATEEPEDRQEIIYSSYREIPASVQIIPNRGDHYPRLPDSPHLQVKSSFVETPASYPSDPYPLSLPDHVHSNVGIHYVDHEPYYPFNVSSNPPNTIQDTAIFSRIHDPVSESYLSRTDPIDLSSPQEFDLVNQETFYLNQGAYKEVVSDVNSSYVHGQARAELAPLASDTIPWARNEQNALEMFESTYPVYQGSQCIMPPRILHGGAISEHQYKGPGSPQMNEFCEFYTEAPARSRYYMDTTKERSSVFTRLSGQRRISPRRKTTAFKRQFDVPVEITSRKKKSSTNSKSERVLVEDEVWLEQSTSVDPHAVFSSQETEEKNTISQQPLVSFKRRSEAKKTADQGETKNSVLERESDQPTSTHKLKRKKLRRPSLVEDDVEKQNISHSTQQLSRVGETNEATAAEGRLAEEEVKLER